LFHRLEGTPPERFKQRLVKSYHLICSMGQADYYISVCESLQVGMFTALYLTYILPTTQQLARPLDRKVAVIGLTKTLTDSQAFATKYVKGWAKTCEALLKLLENPPMPVAADDVIIEADVEDLSFGVGFTQLTVCKKVPRDEWPEVTDVKRLVGMSTSGCPRKLRRCWRLI